MACESDLELEFVTFLSFEQELAGEGPRPAIEKPASDVKGRLRLRFKQDLSQADYKLEVLNAHGTNNINERITQAHLHAGRTFENGDIIVTLFQHSALTEPGIAIDGTLARGTITNTSITPRVTSRHRFNSVASLYDGIRRGEVYANVHGSSFDATKVSHAVGIARGQVLAVNTSA